MTRATRVELTPFYRALAGDVEWPSVDERVASHLRQDGADLLVADTLEAIDSHAWPAADRPTLARRRHDAIAHELLETSLLSNTLRGFDSGGVPCLILKGAAIARTHYQRSWWRPRNDIDLLIPADDLPQAESALQAAGWQPIVEPSQPLVSGQRHFSHSEAGTPTLDLHVRLVAPVLEHAPAFDELWKSRRAVPGLGATAFTLGDADALWYACVHLALHHTGNAAPLWLFDLDRLAHSLDDVAWADFLSRAGATRTRALCSELLERTADCFGTPLPEEIRHWRAIPGESSERFLTARSELRIQWLNLQALRGWRARAVWMRAHLFPDAAYMRERYGVRSRPGLTLAYTRRVVVGALRWIGDALAGQR